MKMTTAQKIEQHKKYIEKAKKQYNQAAAQETPYDVASGARTWSQGDYTPMMDKMAEDWAILELELKELEKQRRIEVENLKAQWLADPCWDLETTEGFEDVKQELYAWKVDQVNTSKKEWFERINKRAYDLNCSYSLADYIIKLEDRLESIERKITNE